ncbi:MAG: RtcB family protein [Nitrospirae bacterium]|nr:RtcB family protein [Nitrospirota bacterium]
MNGSRETMKLASVPWEQDAVRMKGKLTMLSLGEPGEPQIRDRLADIAGLPEVDSVLALPDLHQKADMEIPSSIAIATRDVIVPEFTSVAVNDGMGIVMTDLRADDLSPDRLEAFFARVNSHAAAHAFDTNRYSLSADELRRVLVEGGQGVIGKYGFDQQVLDRIEGKGCVPIGGDLGANGGVVPFQLLRTPFCRAEMGLNFGGNHFLEVQVVDRLLDRSLGARWGFKEGQVVVMYHLGPGPFGGTLLHHYSRRSKLYGPRIAMFFLSKLLFHYGQRMMHGSVGRKWALHFRQNGWTMFPAHSEEGVMLRQAIAMATNFGFAYRLATVKAICDGVREALSPRATTDLFCDIPHNGIWEEMVEGKRAWVARHNACRLVPDRPTIVAGSFDVPSYLGVGADGTEGRYHSYDHGAGNLIEVARRSNRLPTAEGSVTRFRMTRGRKGAVLKREEVPARSSDPIDRLMGCLERHRIMRPVVKLRPVGNLKNG